MSRIDLFGGPLDGMMREWKDPLPPQILFPVNRRDPSIYMKEPEPWRLIPMRVLVYRHRSLGAYDFVEERDH